MLFKINRSKTEEKEVIKYYFDNNVIKTRDNYGLDEFFSLYDKGKNQKLMACIYDEVYVLNMSDTSSDHIGLLTEIKNNFGEQTTFVGGVKDYIDIGVDPNATINQLNTVIRILEEIKEYYNRTGLVKKINLFVIGSKVFDYMAGSNDLDLMISALEGMKGINKTSIR